MPGDIPRPGRRSVDFTVDATPPASVKSATRTLDIIEYVVLRGRSLVAQEISEALGIPVSSLSYLLGTLVEREYLVRTGRHYASGPGLARLQTHTPVFSLAETVSPLVRTLRIQLNETASFFVRHGWEVEALATESSEHALRYAVRTGSRAALHGFSAGKAFLAAMPDEEFERYLAQTERAAFTATTIVAAAALRAEIDVIRRTGIAHTREEHTPGIHGMGRVARIDDEVVGAFSVAIPAVRFDAAVERRAANLLVRTADLLGSS